MLLKFKVFLKIFLFLFVFWNIEIKYIKMSHMQPYMNVYEDSLNFYEPCGSITLRAKSICKLIIL